jgi:hypothetical protein
VDPSIGSEISDGFFGAHLLGRNENSAIQLLYAAVGGESLTIVSNDEAG